jgi:hypothetical protein
MLLAAGAAPARVPAMARNIERRRVTLGLSHAGHATTVRLSTSFSNSAPHSHRYS